MVKYHNIIQVANIQYQNLVNSYSVIVVPKVYCIRCITVTIIASINVNVVNSIPITTIQC